jgi:hypothetical protein
VIACLSSSRSRRYSCRARSNTARQSSLRRRRPQAQRRHRPVEAGAVGTAQLKHNAVTASRIAPNAIRTAQIVNGSLLAEDFKPDQLPQGPKGDKGDKGDKERREIKESRARARRSSGRRSPGTGRSSTSKA